MKKAHSQMPDEFARPQNTLTAFRTVAEPAMSTMANIDERSNMEKNEVLEVQSNRQFSVVDSAINRLVSIILQPNHIILTDIVYRKLQWLCERLQHETDLENINRILDLIEKAKRVLG